MIRDVAACAYKCLGEILIEMGYIPLERLIDGINMGIDVGILTTNQAWHLKSLNAAANSATRTTYYLQVQKYQQTGCLHSGSLAIFTLDA